MAVTSVGPNVYKFTAINDVLRERVRVCAFTAVTDTDAGEISVQGEVTQFNQTANPAMTADITGSELWTSGGMNANETRESPWGPGWIDGLKITSLPTNAYLLVHVG